jgi:hypothetical protein
MPLGEGPRAVQGTITAASSGGLIGCGKWRWRSRLSRKLLILRLTTRGQARSRRGGSRCRSASAIATLGPALLVGLAGFEPAASCS